MQHIDVLNKHYVAVVITDETTWKMNSQNNKCISIKKKLMGKDKEEIYLIKNCALHCYEAGRVTSCTREHIFLTY